MMNRNCPNCGAVIDETSNKCAYCETLYYDLSVIPLNKPFYLTLNVGTEEKPHLITTKVYATNVSITQEPPPVTYITDMEGGYRRSLHYSPHVTFNMEFVSY